MKRIETMAELFAHLITRNDDRPFNEIWEFYFRKYDVSDNIGKMNIEEVKNWLLEDLKYDK